MTVIELTSRDFLNFFAHTHDCAVRVELNGVMVPVAALGYGPQDDAYVITLQVGKDLEMALGTDPIPSPHGPDAWKNHDPSTCAPCQQGRAAAT